MRRSLLAVVLAGLLSSALLAAGCAGPKAPAGSVPESASVAPADAAAWVSLTTDEGSEQWMKADRLLSLFPGARSQLLDAIRAGLQEEGLEWSRDVAPALGPEVAIVATPDGQPIVLTKPDDADKLVALTKTMDGETISGEIDGWTALAQRQEDLDAYRAALDRGALSAETSFTDALDGMPAEALARAWVNGRTLKDMIPGLLGATGGYSPDGSGASPQENPFDLGLDSLAMAIAVEDDGVQLALSATTTKATDGTRFEPKLVGKVPADAVAALSFGGSQSTFDKIRGPLESVSGALEVAGISLESLFDALSGEGVLYVRHGSGTVPEVTLALAPPDAAKAFDAIDKAIRKLAADEQTAVRTSTENGIEISSVEADDATVAYARLDDDTVIVTTGSQGIEDFMSSAGEKLPATAGYTQAAERVGLGELTKGFLYVDLDGLIPLVDELGGADALPEDARDVLEQLDSFIMQSDGDGNTTRLSGFLRVNG